MIFELFFNCITYNYKATGSILFISIRPNKAIERKPNGFIYLVWFQSLCMLRIRRLGRSRGSLFRRFAPYTQTKKALKNSVFQCFFCIFFDSVTQLLSRCLAICYADWVTIISKSIYFFSHLWYNNKKTNGGAYEQGMEFGYSLFGL